MDYKFSHNITKTRASVIDPSNTRALLGKTQKKISGRATKTKRVGGQTPEPLRQ